VLPFDVRRHLGRAIGLPLAEGLHILRLAHDLGRHPLVDPLVDLLAVGIFGHLQPLERPMVGDRHPEMLFTPTDTVRPDSRGLLL